MSEFRLLERIFAANDRLRTARVDVSIPPGDDMAAMSLRELAEGALLIAVDQVIAGRHFRAGTPWALVGRKAVARNISDIAAMAAQPLSCVAAVALPMGFPEEDAATLFEAVRASAEAFGCPLIGGDTGTLPRRDDALVCAVTVLATLPSGVPRAIRRDGARPGDVVCVTGELGATLDDDGFGHHLSFVPRVEEAIELARMLGPRLHAMIDLSDGLGRDLGHIAALSRVRLRIDASRLPCRRACHWRRAIGDGEDYELAFTAEGPVPRSVKGVPITIVGTVVDDAASKDFGGAGPAAVEVFAEGRSFDGSTIGWEH
ncbi:MAG: thiamine-phosphate kinase [Phycisphaerales bacterium]